MKQGQSHAMEVPQFVESLLPDIWGGGGGGYWQRQFSVCHRGGSFSEGVGFFIFGVAFLGFSCISHVRNIYPLHLYLLYSLREIRSHFPLIFSSSRFLLTVVVGILKINVPLWLSKFFTNPLYSNNSDD